MTGLLYTDALVHDDEAENDGRNRERTLRWRDYCASFMRTAGGLQVGPPLRLESPWTDSGEIDGLRDWTVMARRQKRINLPATLDQALERAATDGKKYAAVVLHRRAHEVQDAYVLMTFGQFTELLSTTATPREKS